MKSNGVPQALAELAASDTVGRIWRRDHTVWRTDPREISDRQGWLTVAQDMRRQIPDLQAFAERVRLDGYSHVMLLGMGGSSLGPEVLRQTFTPVSGYPAMSVLDSTVPAQVRAFAGSIDPARTLFIVSSKSGGTAETLAYYRYFRGLVDAGGGDGRNFAAITDAGTSLERLAASEGFRRAFPNPPDIGGRYSVLSYFGLVPAALAGIDLAQLLDHADAMAASCSAGTPADANPGAQLGAFMAGAARVGQDKLTLVAPPPVDSFGLWAEQLLAESLGKEGKGIIPVAGEPLLEPEFYGQDRAFVYITVSSAPAPATDAAMKNIEDAGHPVLRLVLADRYALGAEFFRWELAVAVAGSLLDVHPFDQPDVQGSKDMTDAVLAEFLANGALPEPAPPGDLSAMLAGSNAGDYLAVMAYIPMSPETDELLVQLRQKVMERCHIATTAGYGPRFLHSTGQLHKGGPDSGMFLQLTTSHQDLAIPSEKFGFGTLVSAQAIGDFQALTALGRRCVRADLGPDPIAGLKRLLELA